MHFRRIYTCFIYHDACRIPQTQWLDHFHCFISMVWVINQGLVQKGIDKEEASGMVWHIWLKQEMVLEFLQIV